MIVNQRVDSSGFAAKWIYFNDLLREKDSQNQSVRKVHKAHIGTNPAADDKWSKQ